MNAWMNDTANSKPVIAKKITTKGNPIKKPRMLADSRVTSIPLQVNSKVWPAVIFAISRVPKDRDRLA